MEVASEINELFQFSLGVGCSTNAVIEVTAEELGNSTDVRTEEGLFGITDKGAGAFVDDGLAGVVGLVDLGEQVEPGNAGLGGFKVGGGGGDVTRGDEVMDSVGDSGLTGRGGVVVKGKVQHGVGELASGLRDIE
eukprot:g47587.t1